MSNNTNNICDLVYSKNFNNIVVGLEDRHCPFLYYNILPYMLCLARGGRFGWIRYSSDNRYRKKILKDDFSRKDVNRLYTNEVLVRCPNTMVNLVCGIGPYSTDRIKIRILDMETSCPKNYIIKDEYFVKVNDILDKSQKWNKTFLMSVCKPHDYLWDGLYNIDDNGYEIKIDEIIDSCRYSCMKKIYRRPFIPQGFCMHLFQLIYPDILSVMYDAEMPEKIKLMCYCQEEPLEVSVRKEYKKSFFIFNSLISIAENVFERLFYPYDRLNYIIKIKVDNIVSDKCVLKKGYIYEANVKDKNFICPASLYSLYPFLTMLNTGRGIIDKDILDRIHIPCPDCKGIIYKVDKCYK